MTRRKLLLWGVPAVLVVAVVAIFTVLVLNPSEAARQSKKVQVGMTTKEVRAAMGDPEVQISVSTSSDGRVVRTVRFRDSSCVSLWLDDDRLTAWKVHLSQDPSWQERLRDLLRKVGLPI